MENNKILYIEANFGISGDMFVAAMIDLGEKLGLTGDDALSEKIRRTVASLNENRFDIAISRKKVAAIDVCDFDVILDEGYENHDHDMDFLYGHEKAADTPAHEHTHAHSHDGNTHTHDHAHEHEHDHIHDEHEHTHDHGHSHDHEHSDHAHRTLEDVKSILKDADMTEGARELATRVFEILAAAEATAHGTTTDKVHFHEVGALDSIADITAAAVCVDVLGIKNVVISPLSEGSGTVRTAHGILPIPVPAVTNIAVAHALTISKSTIPGEHVTPTGAAIAAAIKTSDTLPDRYTIKAVGIGGGKRSYDPPSMLRAMVLEHDK